MALGSSRAGVVLAILRRPIVQIVAGVIVGTIAGIAFNRVVSEGKSPGGLLGLSAYIALIVASCVLASVAPVRRALKVDPIAALRND
jgi:ABC-type antimicrobial peptide transport system permease subunit